MKINSANVISVEKDIKLSVSYKRKSFEIIVTTQNGRVSSNVKTAYLTYFNDTPVEIQNKHFGEIKKYIENNFE
jgi:hypothetical protein